MELLQGTKAGTALALIAGITLLAIGVGIAEAQSGNIIGGTLEMGGNPVTGTHQVDAHWEDDGSDAGKATATNGVWFMTVEQADGRAPGATLRISVDGTQVATGIPWPWDGKPIALELPSPSAATPAPAPTYTPQPTYTPPPTFTPQPTYTPGPTPLPTPTATPATPTDRAGGRVEGFDSPPRVALRPVVDVVGADEDGLIEFAMANPRRNSVNLEVELILRVPSGIHIYSSDGTYASGAGMGSVYYLVKPGDTRTIQFFVQADKVGKFTISGTAEYGPEHHRALWNPINLTHPFTVEQATSRSRVRAQAAEAPAPPLQQEGQPGGCSIGAPSGGPTDLSAVIFGGAMLTGLGMVLVRRRRD